MLDEKELFGIELSDLFLQAFIGEVVSCMGPGVLSKDENGEYYLHDTEDTAGWFVAFRKACDKVGCTPLYEKYMGGEYPERDALAYVISEKAGKLAEQSPWSNDYYKFLFGRDKDSNEPRISQLLIAAVAGELYSIFGNSIEGTLDGEIYLHAVIGSSGWERALEEACRKTANNEVLYWRKIADRQQRDDFDNALISEIDKALSNPDSMQRAGESYLRFLITKHNENNLEATKDEL